ncbi:MAG TPA: 50S ribosomal protein L18 [Polyangia bacterium]|nr:50S ribosomal protein L18 [Polyangia bacterium]
MLSDTSRKKQSRKKRHRSLRKRVEGTSERPRLAVFRSTRHIYAQVIDDLQQKTLAGTSDLALGGEASGGDDKDKKVVAKKVGAAIAKKCLEKGIDKVVFDRAGFKYHGRVSALAEGARAAGLKF